MDRWGSFKKHTSNFTDPPTPNISLKMSQETDMSLSLIHI